MMAGLSFQGLLVALLIGCVAAIVCPPELVQGAPVGLSEGAKCGGTCNTHGSCAAGLRCKETPTTPFLGVRPAGVCSSAGGHVALDSKDIQTVVKEAVQLLNGQLNSIYMLVPVAILGAEKKHNFEGIVYDLSLALASSTCRNDGAHSPLDPICQPQHGVTPMNLDVVVQEKDSHYALLGHSSIDRPVPVALRI
ncbi:unnamed protein product [Symbiodinium necroappetens]|uniref:Uncharacterized protein n=1 Tax=Symbiodinium necroappetens TaxID=1628268 RepID=A0A812RHM3_9DINO|nr:unnamed protein product [Symbiodinium necroappetens]